MGAYSDTCAEKVHPAFAKLFLFFNRHKFFPLRSQMSRVLGSLGSTLARLGTIIGTAVLIGPQVLFDVEGAPSLSFPLRRVPACFFSGRASRLTPLIFFFVHQLATVRSSSTAFRVSLTRYATLFVFVLMNSV